MAKRHINVAHTTENLKQLLIQVINKNNLFTHEELANWCCNYTDNLRDSNLVRRADINGFSVAEDIDCQWELNLTNSYTLEQLQLVDKSTIKFPENWFKNWLSKIVKYVGH